MSRKWKGPMLQIWQDGVLNFNNPLIRLCQNTKTRCHFQSFSDPVYFFHVQCEHVYQLWHQLKGAKITFRYASLYLSRRIEKPAAESIWFIRFMFLINHNALCKRASTWNLVWLIFSILHFTTTQLIKKKMHTDLRSNWSTVMNTKSLMLMQTLIGSVSWWLAKTHAGVWSNANIGH